MSRTAAVLTGVLLAVGCGSPTINVVDPLAVVNWSPHDGATCIDPTWPDLTFSVCLSRPLSASSATAAISLQTVDAAGVPDGEVTATVGLSTGDPACAQITDATLTADTGYAIVLEAALEAEDGTALGHQLMSRFRTRDTSCP
jgi:hypothetical protein